MNAAQNGEAQTVPWYDIRRRVVYSGDVIHLLIEHASVVQGRDLELYDNVRSIDHPMPSGLCLMNAITYAGWMNDDREGWHVVVGVAEDPDYNAENHAWVVDPDGQAWDPTWTDIETSSTGA